MVKYYLKNLNDGRSNLSIVLKGKPITIVFRKKDAKFFLGQDLTAEELAYFRTFKSLKFVLVHNKAVEEKPVEEKIVEEKVVEENIVEEKAVEDTKKADSKDITYDDMDKMSLEELKDVNALKIRGYIYNRYGDSPDIENLHSKAQYIDFLSLKRNNLL